jgi:carboxymethylenebutenolidase
VVDVQLTARDGHVLDAYLARPAGNVRGAVVVGQEMYGLNDYLRGVCDDFAAEGYVAIAPALYDRVQRGLTYSYTKEDHDRAQQASGALDLDAALDDVGAARAWAVGPGAAPRVAIVGFCLGGSLAWLAACRGTYAAAVAYYGALMLDHADERPRCPVIAHVGSRDNALRPDRVAAFCAAQPSVPVYIYPDALHGFDNAGRVERHDPEAHRLARQRTLEFLRQQVG